ncbi:FecCD family ABC transporter permease [Marinicellulosiphila megalodicopiae]|uniref:FecCD family ABC transporter permease n=1 Tax=Marinicellulosiphila megalodicopiae TaxID=2724896 RepID=UPI003BAF5942
MKKPLYFKVSLISALLLLCVFSFLSIGLGAGQYSLFDSINQFITRDTTNAHLHMVIFEYRLPRLVAAILVGSALGLSGALLQIITRNPLAESGLLGVNAGASTGVIIGITFFSAQSSLTYLIFAFIGALIGTITVLLIAQFRTSELMTPIRLILSGIAISAMFSGISALIMLTYQFSFDHYRFWVLGSLSGVQFENIIWIIPAILIAISIVFILSKHLQALLLSDDNAKSLGHHPDSIRFFIALSVALLTGASVAIAGPIAFLGLIAPHLARFFFGHHPNNQMLFSMLIGSLLILSADIVSRLIIQPFEAPLSVLLALFGAPFLIYIVFNNKKGKL